ncbi:site-2 protease family protein [Streptomyces sediminimaris]|uniref:site-2 protease family protein n=1 Tax=Streptomyces sediminimaris TaxID=3383721 RepID=UPI00399B84D3
MDARVSLGRVAGLRFGAHWSVLAVFVLIAAGLAQGRLPVAHSGHTAWVYWGVGLATAVLFLASLLAHEVGHAVVARRNGVPVDGITLWLLDGARLRGEGPSPGVELRIAGAGPLVSLFLGALFGALAGLFALFDAAGLLVEAVAWLAGINVLLALFNALPAAPLDGGRLLRAAVWRRSGDPLRATVLATAVGRVMGWLLAGSGLYLLFLGASFSGILLAVVGWFLIATATAGGGRAGMGEFLSGVSVRDVMTPIPPTVPAGASVRDFLGGCAGHDPHEAVLVVGDDGRPIGLITAQRAARAVSGEEHTTKLGSVVVPLRDLPTATPDCPLVRLLPRLDASPVRRVVVLSADGAPAGIVTSSDVSRLTTWLSSTSPWPRSAGSWQSRKKEVPAGYAEEGEGDEGAPGGMTG